MSLDRREYLLACLSEECHEVGKAAMKALRFGESEERYLKIKDEMQDVLAVWMLLFNENFRDLDDEGVMDAKVARRLRYAPGE